MSKLLFKTLVLLFVWVISDWGEGWLEERVIPEMESTLKGFLEVRGNAPIWLYRLSVHTLGFLCHV